MRVLLLSLLAELTRSTVADEATNTFLPNPVASIQYAVDPVYDDADLSDVIQLSAILVVVASLVLGPIDPPIPTAPLLM